MLIINFETETSAYERKEFTKYTIVIRRKLTFFCSVGNGPSPTLVLYAFTTPTTSPMVDGGTPNPVHTPPILQFDDVTYGYVPN